MQESIIQNEHKSETLGYFLNDKFYPCLKGHLLNSTKYLDSEWESFKNLNNQTFQLQEELTQKKNNWSKSTKQLIEKNQRENDLQKRVEEYKKAKKKELVDKQQTIDAISSAMKDACSKVKPDLIAKLNLDQTLNSVFQNLFAILYDQPQEKFEWNDFKKKGLLFEKGEDFQSRLANFPLKAVPNHKNDILLKIKSDPQFDKLVETPGYTSALIDLSEWVTFCVNGIKFNKEKEDLQNEYDKIQKDFENRKKDLAATQKEQEFWQGSLEYVEDQISFLNNMSRVLDGTQNDISKSQQNLEKHIQHIIVQTNDLNMKLVPTNF